MHMTRPEYHDADADTYMAAVEESIVTGAAIPEPWGADQLRALAARYPEQARRFVPCDRRCLVDIGLPAHFGQPVEPLGELWQDRFLVTLRDDAAFQQAVKTLLGVQ